MLIFNNKLIFFYRLLFQFLGDKMLLRQARCPPGQYNEMASLFYVVRF